MSSAAICFQEPKAVFDESKAASAAIQRLQKAIKAYESTDGEIGYSGQALSCQALAAVAIETAVALTRASAAYDLAAELARAEGMVDP